MIEQEDEEAYHDEMEQDLPLFRLIEALPDDTTTLSVVLELCGYTSPKHQTTLLELDEMIVGASRAAKLRVDKLMAKRRANPEAPDWHRWQSFSGQTGWHADWLAARALVYRAHPKVGSGLQQLYEAQATVLIPDIGAGEMLAIMCECFETDFGEFNLCWQENSIRCWQESWTLRRWCALSEAILH